MIVLFQMNIKTYVQVNKEIVVKRNGDVNKVNWQIDKATQQYQRYHSLRRE